jgi:hypothetical protein
MASTTRRWAIATLTVAAALHAGAAPGAAAAVPVLAADHAMVRLHDWITGRADNAGLPFAILDKRAARLSVFDPDGTLVGQSPVLLGFARGDASAPGIGERPIASIRPFERTTPAGRFVSEPGRNLAGDDIVWVDYNAAISMHRVRPTNPLERRLERLASRTPTDNRISYGCINLPAAFFDQVVAPRLGARAGVVYILPETVAGARLLRWANPVPSPTGPDRGHWARR